MSNVPRQLVGNAPMIESPRKQGHFDPRYGRVDGPELAQDRVSGGESPAGLDWYAFLACNFPVRRRHDLEALKAYEAHRSSVVGTADGALTWGTAAGPG
jgi:hypothetical protein